MSALSNTAPLCIAQAYARSRFGPVNGKHLQETLPPPPLAALEKHGGLQFISVDFGAGLCSSAGRILFGPKQGDWLMDVHSSFPLPRFAAWLLGAGAQNKLQPGGEDP